MDSDICTSPASNPKHGGQVDLNPAVWGPGVLVNEVTDARSRRSLENNAFKPEVTYL